MTSDLRVQIPTLPPLSMRQAIGGPNNEMDLIARDLLYMVWAILSSNPTNEKYKLIMNFWGISIPFCTGRYNKNMEFSCEKQSQGRANDGFLEKRVKSVFRRWQKRWIVVGYNNLFYYESPEDPPTAIRDNIIWDSDTLFEIQHIGMRHVVGEFQISRRKLKIQFDGTMNGLICISYIVKAFRKSQYTAPHRFTSFAPIRENNDCTFFSDGIGYFEEAFKAFEQAKSEILITDWWMSPELPLLRPTKSDLEHERSRLDKTLQRAAIRGVRIYILVYKEFAVSMNNDSEHTERALEAMHHNIKVMRHPNVVVSLWSHHEKCIIVDKSILFMGGLDLCWGRMDGNNHPLFNDADMHKFPGADYYNPLKKDIPKGREYQKSPIEQSYPRMPWHDIAVMIVGKVVTDFVVHFNAYWNHAKETNGEEEVLVNKIAGPAPNDAAGYHIDYQGAEVDPMYDLSSNPNDSIFGRQDAIQQAIQVNSFGKRGPNAAMNAVLRQEYDRQFQETHRGSTNVFAVLAGAGGQQPPFNPSSYNQYGYQPNFGASPLMLRTAPNPQNPFSQLGGAAYGSNPSFVGGSDLMILRGNNEANDDAHWQNWMRANGQKHFGDAAPTMMNIANFINTTFKPAAQSINNDLLARINRPIEDWWKPGRQSFTDLFKNININQDSQSNPFQMMGLPMMGSPIVGIPLMGAGGFPIFSEHRVDEFDIYEHHFVSKEQSDKLLTMQALRSASPWSLGRRTVESSIHECYLEAIANADRFIYIENQFIISSTGTSGVENLIIKAVFNRIKRAFEEGTPFKVIIFLPLLPAFEASLEDQQGKVMQIQIGLENQTIGVGSQSLLGKLQELLQGSKMLPENYLMVCGLRTWDIRESDKKPVTELIYIHSKVDID